MSIKSTKKSFAREQKKMLVGMRAQGVWEEGRVYSVFSVSELAWSVMARQTLRDDLLRLALVQFRFQTSRQ